MSLEEIVKVTKSIGEQLMNVNLTGGEPFLRTDLYEIARAYVINAKVNSVFITSHGGFTKKIIKFAETFKKDFPDKMLLISISLDGPEDVHDKIRKIPGLYSKAMETYRQLREVGGQVLANFAMTITPYNYKTADQFYDYLSEIEKVDSVTITLVREEGVFKLPDGDNKELIETYDKIGKKILQQNIQKSNSGKAGGNYLSRMINEKNKIMTDLISETFKEDKFILPCQSGKLFGIIYPNGSVFPCEILNKPLGNLKEFDFNFDQLWSSKQSGEVTDWIEKTECHCTYECAWSYNILVSKKYYPNFIKAILKY
jgi:radical SAM protein with 4Fe4S-binding SPASM domain